MCVCVCKTLCVRERQRDWCLPAGGVSRNGGALASDQGLELWYTSVQVRAGLTVGVW